MAQKKVVQQVPPGSWLTWPESETTKRNVIDLFDGHLLSEGLPLVLKNDPKATRTQLNEYETIIRNILRLFRTGGPGSDGPSRGTVGEKECGPVSYGGRVGGFTSGTTVFDEIVHKYRLQEDNCLNQYEDIVYSLMAIALRDYPPTNETTRAMKERGFSRLEEYALYRFHWKLFKNYRRWCQYVDVRPFPWGESKATTAKPATKGAATGTQQGASGGASGSMAAYLKEKEKMRKNPKTSLMLMAREVALWKLMWGESANLRHCPELLLFVFHWMMKSWDDVDPTKMPTYVETITPVINEFWEEMRRASGDHPVKMNYEDFNEIFHKAPVVHRWLGGVGERGRGGTWRGNFMEMIKAETTSHQFLSLQPPKGRKKTYIEQRSYLHFFRTWWRYYQFNLVTLFISLAYGAQNRGWDATGWWGMVTVCAATGSAVREMFDLFFYWLAPIPLLQRCYDAMEGMKRLNWWARQIMAGIRWALFLAAVYVSRSSPLGCSDPALQPSGYVGGACFMFYVLHGLSYFLIRVRKTLPCWQNGPPTWNTHATFQGNATMLSDEYKHMFGYALFWMPVLCFKWWIGYHVFVRAFLDLLLPMNQSGSDPIRYDFLGYEINDRVKVTLYVFWISPCMVLYFYDIMFYFSVFQSFVSWCIGWFRGIGFITDLSVIQKVFPLLPLQYDRVLSTDAGGTVRKLKLATTSSPKTLGWDWLVSVITCNMCCGVFQRKIRRKVKPTSYYMSHSRPHYALPLRAPSRTCSRQSKASCTSKKRGPLTKKATYSSLASDGTDSLTTVLLRHVPVSPRASHLMRTTANGSSTAPRRGLSLLHGQASNEGDSSVSPKASTADKTPPSDAGGGDGTVPLLQKSSTSSKSPGAVEQGQGSGVFSPGGARLSKGGGSSGSDKGKGKRGFFLMDGSGSGWVSWWIREISAVYDHVIPPATVENQIRRFGFLWNEVLESWREEDLIDNTERCKLQFNELPAIHFKDLSDLNMAFSDCEGSSLRVSWDASDIRHPVWVYCDVLKSFTRECEAHQTRVNEIWENLRDHHRFSKESHHYLHEVLKLPPPTSTPSRLRWPGPTVNHKAKASLHQVGHDFVKKLFGNTRAAVGDPRSDSHQLLLRMALLEIYEALCLYLTRFFPDGHTLTLRLSAVMQRVASHPFCLCLLNLAAVKDLQATLATTFAAAQGDNAAAIEENGVRLLKALQKMALPALFHTPGSSVLASKGMKQHFPELVDFLEALSETTAARQSLKSMVASPLLSSRPPDRDNSSKADTPAVSSTHPHSDPASPPCFTTPHGTPSFGSSRHTTMCEDDTPASSIQSIRDPRVSGPSAAAHRRQRPPLPPGGVGGGPGTMWMRMDLAAEVAYCDKLWRLEELQEGVCSNDQLTVSEALKPFFRRSNRILTAKGHVLKTALAQARLKYFSSSLFMEMPEAPSVQRMVSMCTFTPTYTEDAMLDASMLNEKTMEGVRQFDFLRTMYCQEWANFLERMDPQGVRYDWYQHSLAHKNVLSKSTNIMAAKFEKDIEEWASERTQTLWRTLKSVMYYEQACRMLAWMELQEQRGETAHLCHDRNMLSFEQNDRLNWTLVPVQPDSPKKLQVFLRYWERCRERRKVLDNRPYDNDPVAKALATLRFQYVLTAQTLGDDLKAPSSNRVATLRVRCVTEMCKRYPSMRVAAIESCDIRLPGSNKPKSVKCSVLYKWDVGQQKLVRVYRVVLGLLEGACGARNPIVGEGKSENQNHAIIFTRGETIQAIDMNQEMYLEEALKLRNLLQEFAKDTKMAIMGFREHAFLPGAVTPSYLSNVQQTCFTAFDARAFHMPMRIRFHYGHPDVLDRYLVKTMGGMSRGSAIINVTEDVYCGMNYVQRGYSSAQVDYIMCSKGWPNDLDQVVAFMRKIATGSAEAQAASRDAYRMAYGMDFFRLLSLFVAFPGWNILNPLVFLSIWLFMYGRIVLSAFSSAIPVLLQPFLVSEELNAVTIMDRVWLLLFAISYLKFGAMVALEEGLAGGIRHMWHHIRALSPLHYTFTIGTWLGSFDETVLFGRAKYQSAGRGFNINHKTFVHLWKAYFYSHFQLAMELLLLLFYLRFLQDLQPMVAIRCWWFILVPVSFLYVPHLYNPMGLAWSRLTSDFTGWSRWLRSNNNHDVEESWYAWWKQQMEFRNGASPLNKIIILTRELRFLLLGLCIAKAANWHWYHLVTSPGGAGWSWAWESIRDLVERSPLLAPAVFTALVVLVMGLSTHNQDYHPSLHTRRGQIGFMSGLSNAGSRFFTLLTRIGAFALIVLFLYNLITDTTYRLSFGTIVGGMVACLLAFLSITTVLAECFGFVEWSPVVETHRLWHFLLGALQLAPLIALAALKYVFNTSELQTYYLLNSYGVARSQLHMGHVRKMLQKIRMEQKHHSKPQQHQQQQPGTPVNNASNNNNTPVQTPKSDAGREMAMDGVCDDQQSESRMQTPIAIRYQYSSSSPVPTAITCDSEAVPDVPDDPQVRTPLPDTDTPQNNVSGQDDTPQTAAGEPQLAPDEPETYVDQPQPRSPEAAVDAPVDAPPEADPDVETQAAPAPPAEGGGMVVEDMSLVIADRGEADGACVDDHDLDRHSVASSITSDGDLMSSKQSDMFGDLFEEEDEDEDEETLHDPAVPPNDGLARESPEALVAGMIGRERERRAAERARQEEAIERVMREARERREREGPESDEERHWFT
ncbi:unnamed protein product [Vitrella brassicaformis CCMP3155]|uniref:1,3-beta-glucan synthase n=2 Tax=Vitrella brassicaformis TaxID=1169539 RepID=A0A0G4E9F0_VITBC|nr:unnamed protein product [Vitrella brassicaformis CCMP3155]|eukprot:CEL92502.1 unnamed protein product [Vitrella brassicaformis CCMP3155]